MNQRSPDLSFQNKLFSYFNGNIKNNTFLYLSTASLLHFCDKRYLKVIWKSTVEDILQ